MIVGPTLGTGLFIGSGPGLAAGGPLSLLISYIFISVLVYCLTTAIAEVAAHMPADDGTAVTHTYQYGWSHLGFALGYLRWYSFALMVPFEITNAMVNIGLWDPGAQVALRVAIVCLVISGFNLLPERLFKRSEVMFTGLKLFTTVGLVILSLVLASIPGSSAGGFHYWRDPGAMHAYTTGGSLGRFLGLVQCLVYSTVSFIFTPELIVQRAEQEVSESRSNILRSSTTTSVIHSLLYTLSVLAIGVMSPYDEPRLTNNGLGAGLIFLSSVASGRSFLYLSSRTLCSLAEAGHAPTVFKARASWGVPYVSIAASAAFSTLAFLSAGEPSSLVYNWLMFFITTSGYISWMSWCIVYLLFRRSTKAQGFTSVHQSWIQPYGTYFGMVVCSVLSLANTLTIAAPCPLPTTDSIPAYMGLAVFVLLYSGHFLNATVTGRVFRRRGNVVDIEKRADATDRSETRP
ncbi:putative proline permease [Aspergillus campestris IBT 28561]|uniref:Proline permease n=1 Tax=Aspergillus campestris (strain IBT 28561) TaxID=1392248 RepID=A0A2I1CV00_ASPC2|nr:putative proline permease [Aspergillus campestris IBT 28561]PKY01460.1 putative proline permease [Aspergillus campestris IBT 28561]